MHFFVQDWDSLIEYKEGRKGQCWMEWSFVRWLQEWWVEYVHGMDGWMDRIGEERIGEDKNLLNISETISTSVSAAAIFSAEESWGRPPKRKDIF